MTHPTPQHTPLFDTHCHIDYLLRGNWTPAMLAPVLQAANVSLMINPGTCIAQLPDVLAAAETLPGVYAAAALHPTDVAERPDDWLAQLEHAMHHPKVVAVGETGLDYYRPEQQDLDNQAQQHLCFNASLQLAKTHNKPVIVHDREAHDDVAAVIADHPGVQGVMHCFSGDIAFAERMIALGFYISFAGNVTFKNAYALHEAARHIPLEWLLIETDSPFLSPMPHRGTPNDPSRVALVAAHIAQLRGMPTQDLIAATTRNGCRLFNVLLPLGLEN
jgi:TatD DNase family protein